MAAPKIPRTTKPHPGDPPPRSFARKIRPFLVVTAELSGALTLAGAIISILFNSIKFNRWGLNFVEIATASDILMSGIRFAELALGLVVPLFAIALVGALAALRCGDRRVLRTADVGFALAIIALIGLGLDHWIKNQFEAKGGFLQIFFIDAILLAMLFFCAAFSLLRRRGGYVVVVQTSLAAAALLCAAAVLNYGGGALRPLTVHTDNDLLCYEPMSAEWIGSQSIVASCITDAKEYFVLNRDGVVLETEDAHAAEQLTRRVRARRFFDRSGTHDWRVLGKSVSRKKIRDPIFFSAIDLSTLKVDGATRTFWMAQRPDGPNQRIARLLDVKVGCSDRGVRISIAAVYNVLPHGGLTRDRVERLTVHNTSEDGLPPDLAQIICDADLTALPRATLSLPYYVPGSANAQTH